MMTYDSSPGTSGRLRSLLTAAAAVIVCSVQAPPPMRAAAEMPGTQSTLPVISVETTGGYGFIKDEYVDADFTLWDETGAQEMTDTAVRVRLRGNSSRTVPKKSFKLHFPDKANPLQIGKGKAKTWVLNANHYDASLLRNWTALRIGSMLDGLPYTPHCRSTDLYIDGEYYGVYLLTEAVSVNKHRVNIKEAADQVEDNGYLIEMTRYAKEPAFEADCFQFEVKSTLSDDEDTANKQLEYISGYTKDALHALQNGDQDTAAQYVDISSLVDNCLLNEICKNVDVGWDSYYLCKDAGGKLTFCPVWDFDIAFANCGYVQVYTVVEGEGLFAFSDSTADCNPWLCYAMRSAWFRDLLKARWEEMLPELKKIPAEILAEAEKNSEAYQRNHDKRRGELNYMTGDDPDTDYYTHLGQAKLLADWISARIGWLDAYYDTPEYAAGIFPDERGKPLPVENQLAVSMISDGRNVEDYTNLSYSGYAGSAHDFVRFDQLMLAAGQTYRLSFACSGDGDAEVSCRVQTEEETFTKSFAVPAEPQTVSFMFTPKATDMQANVKLDLEGSGTVQVSHLVLTKLPQAVVRGDLNRDGKVTSADLSLLKQMLRNPEHADQPEGDWNGDNALTDDDARGLLCFLLGLPDNGLGLNPQIFRAALPGVDITIDGDNVLQTGTVNGQAYSLTLNLSKWERNTKPEQLVTLSRLFWQCYPRMWARYADLSEAPKDVVLAVENEGYGVAEASGNFVHLHDEWLRKYPEDFDCITHELAHVIQNGWDSDYLEDSGYIERFADCSRYEYAMDNGYYNDGEWTLQTVADEPTRNASVRFLVWLDYYYTDENADILRNFLSVCRNSKISSSQWARGWQAVFSGTQLEGKTVDEVWAMFAASDFADLSSYSDHGSGSELLSQYPIREKITQREQQ